MEIVILPLSLISLLAIAIMLGTLIIAYIRKIMMTYALLIANLLVFSLSLFFSNTLIVELGFRPAYLSTEFSPQLYTLFTSMFIHSGLLHILGNMLVLFFMGIPLEQRIGRKKFIIIYLLTGVCATLAFSIVNLGSDILLVGASGAIFGILGAFAYSYPRDEIVMPIPVFILMIVRIKVIIGVLIFAAMESVFVLLGTEDGTAHVAHIGGLVVGVLLAALIVGKQGDRLKKTEGMAQYDTTIPTGDTINFSNLQPLAQTTELQKILQRIEQENVRQVRDIWLEHFLEKATCPVCKKPLNHVQRKIWCEQEHFRTTY
jgi:membrane associated rhomboid family serine protease